MLEQILLQLEFDMCQCLSKFSALNGAYLELDICNNFTLDPLLNSCVGTADILYCKEHCIYNNMHVLSISDR